MSISESTVSVVFYVFVNFMNSGDVFWGLESLDLEGRYLLDALSDDQEASWDLPEELIETGGSCGKTGIAGCGKSGKTRILLT